jgi:hypothetical protein
MLASVKKVKREKRLMPENESFETGAYRGHGDAYRWLREHYETITHWIEKRNPTGEAIAARVGRAGIIGARGRPPTSRAVRKVWQRVCRDMKVEEDKLREKEAAKEAAAYQRATGAPLKKRYPSDFPKDWRPEEVVKPSTGEGRALTVASPTAIDGVNLADLPPDGLTVAQLGRRSREFAIRRLDYISGRGPKR